MSPQPGASPECLTAEEPELGDKAGVGRRDPGVLPGMWEDSGGEEGEDWKVIES